MKTQCSRIVLCFAIFAAELATATAGRGEESSSGPSVSASSNPAVRPTPPVPSASAPGPDSSLPGTVAPADGDEDRSLPSNPRGIGGRLGEILPLPIPARGDSPGGLPSGTRPRPGSLFDPGASGPGISQDEENFLGGALDPKTGWPFVLLDHFAPRRDRVERVWVVNTRDVPQEMGTDPWPRLKVRHFDERGNLVEVDPSLLFDQVEGHPAFIQVQGSLTTPDIALGGLLWTHSWLERNRAIPADTVMIAFDWPSQRVYRNDVRDIEEKGRRAYVAGYHLARFLQAFPPQSRICVLGQSYGGRVVPSALHLLGGGALNSQNHDPSICLSESRPDLQIRGIILGAADDHDWLNPGKRLDHALNGCEAFLNLYNHRDEALRFYPLLMRSTHHRALGRLGLTNRDLAQLGPRAAKYSELDVEDILRSEHSLLNAVSNAEICRRIAPYAWADDPGPTELRADDPNASGFRGNRGRPGIWRGRGRGQGTAN